VLIFIFQGRTIAEKPLHILLLAVPIILQVLFNFVVTYAIGYEACIEHEKLGPASLIATSNFFELAVAVAISVYGLDSGAALATVVGVLVEVPVMLGLVHVCNYLRPRLERRIAAEGKAGGGGKGWCGGGGGGSGRMVGPVGPPVSDDTTAIVERV
jgi:arsenite transporter